MIGHTNYFWYCESADGLSPMPYSEVESVLQLQYLKGIKVSKPVSIRKKFNIACLYVDIWKICNNFDTLYFVNSLILVGTFRNTMSA